MEKLELCPELESFRNIFEKTVISYVNITTRINNNLPIWASKFGGKPYLPESFDYPVNSQNEKLCLLAQINFDEMPSLNLFPEKGLLQFYLSRNYYTNDFINNPTKQDNFRVIYFPDYDKTIDGVNTDGSVPEYDESEFPVRRQLELIFNQEQEPVSLKDSLCWNYYFPEYNNYHADVLKAKDTQDEDYFNEQFWTYGFLMTRYYFFEQFRKHENDVILPEQWYGENFRDHENKNKFGGYSNFSQDDPRSFPHHEYNIQLLQMISMSDSGVMWGDCGMAHFFIKQEDLIRKDFSNVFFEWNGC